MKFFDNIKNVWKKESFWVAAIGSGVVAAWPLMPTIIQTDLFTALPIMHLVAPVVWFVTFIVAHAIPAKEAPVVEAPVTPVV